jgi:formiminoglutamase
MLMKKGFKKYFIFLVWKLHFKSVLDIIKKIEDRVRYNTYDSVNIRKEKDFNQEMALALEFINDDFWNWNWFRFYSKYCL